MKHNNLQEAHLNQDSVSYAVYSMASPHGEKIMQTDSESEAKDFATEFHKLRGVTVEVYETKTTTREILKLEI